MDINGIPVYEDPYVPLTSLKYDDDGNEVGRVDALCWIIEGVISVHPDRMPLFADIASGPACRKRIQELVRSVIPTHVTVPE